MAAQNVRVATEKVWKSRADESQLVKDGHKDAMVLFARKGQVLPSHEVDKFVNAEDFFTGGESAPAEKKHAKKK